MVSVHIHLVLHLEINPNLMIELLGHFKLGKNRHERITSATSANLGGLAEVILMKNEVK